MNEDLHREFIEDFTIESVEALDAFDKELLALEQGQGGMDALRTAFRLIHTIKGSSGCLGLTNIESLGHAAENLLTLLRDGKCNVTPQTISALLRSSDALRAMIQRPDEPGPDTQPLIIVLQKLVEEAERGENLHSAAPPSFGFFETPSPAAPADKPPDTPVASEPVKPSAPPMESAKPLPPITTESSRPSAADNAIRVDVAQIDRLMNLVGELVLARNQIMQYSGLHPEPALITAVQRVNLITTELQENVMKTRMQPIANVWSKFPRVVRDLSLELNKQVSLVMEGRETELDRTIIEAIRDPLTHILRNAIDHGLEKPDERAKAGKSAEGTGLLRSFHEGGQVIIEVTDDGAGIDYHKIAQKAVQKGLISSEQLGRMSEREIANLLFLPGLSTAEKVTNISGRGVGMDVVKTNIEKIGGSVDIQTELGRRTTFRIKIPLTLAIIPALIIVSGDEQYAIPQASLVELVRVEAEQVRTSIERVHGAPVYRLRGNLLPLVDLAQQLGGSPKSGDENESLYLIVLQAEGRQFGLIVDEICDTEEIVVKPLGKELKNVTVYAGATIMGDGKVALILDVFGLARRAGIIQQDEGNALKDLGQELKGHSEENGESLLIVTVGTTRMAIPVACITRLEEFPLSSIEHAGGAEVVQYRGRIMPLLRIADTLGRMGHYETENTELRVVVCSINKRCVGLVIDRIEDIVDESIVIEKSYQTGLVGTAVVHQKVTDIVDVNRLVLLANIPGFAEAA